MDKAPHLHSCKHCEESVMPEACPFFLYEWQLPSDSAQVDLMAVTKPAAVDTEEVEL